MIYIQSVLFVLLILSIANAVATFRIKWYMHKNPPLSFEMDGDHITDAYFERMRREIQANL